MSISVGSALFAYLLSVICSMVVSKRSSNWRIRLLALTVGMLPLCQAVALLGSHKIWLSTEVSDMAESLELLVGALSLTAIHLLNKENGDRRNTDARLRVAERGESMKLRIVRHYHRFEVLLTFGHKTYSIDGSVHFAATRRHIRDFILETAEGQELDVLVGELIG
jgi:hypothetical protein